MKTITKFESVAAEKLVPYARNARTHSEKQILQLRSSLREFGFISPAVIDKEYNIIAGHARVEAAKAENFKEIPCVFAEHLTESQKKAYIIADNKLALNSDWDEEMLAVEFADLKDMDFDLNLLGFNDKEINKFFGECIYPADVEPTFGSGNFKYKEQYGIIVMCRDEAHQQEIYEQLLENGYDCRVVAT